MYPHRGYGGTSIVPNNTNFSAYIASSCHAQAYVAFSDERIKINIVDMHDANALDQLRLQPKYYPSRTSTHPTWMLRAIRSSHTTNLMKKKELTLVEVVDEHTIRVDTELPGEDVFLSTTSIRISCGL